MELIEQLASGDDEWVRSPHRQAGGRRWVVRPFRHVGMGSKQDLDRLFSVHFPSVDGLIGWTQFHVIEEARRRQLGLKPGVSVVALRPYVDATPLPEALAERSLSRLQVLASVANIVQALHAQSGMHGGIHPGNVLVKDTGEIVLVDRTPFGMGLTEYVDEKRSTDPFCAPEVREDGECVARSDVYSLAALGCWMADGDDRNKTNEYDPSDVAETVPRPVANVLRQGLGAHPDIRPSARQFVQAVDDCGVTTGETFVTLPPSLYRSLGRKAIEALQAGERAVILEGAKKTGKSFALGRLRRRLQLAGRRVVHCNAAAIFGPQPGSRREIGGRAGGWAPIRALVEAFDDDVESDQVTGHRRHVFETWYQRLRAAVPRGETIVLWDDLDATRPDVRAFVEYLMAAWDDESSASMLRFVATSESNALSSIDASRLTVIGPSKRTWDGWRARTKLAHIRDISDRRWNEIATQYAHRPVELFEAINESIGLDRMPEFAQGAPSRDGVPDVSVIFAGNWRQHLRDLMTGGACIEAVQTCEKLADVLCRSGSEERRQILRMWLHALELAGPSPQRLEKFRRAIDDADEDGQTDPHIAVLRARFLWKTGQYRQGLATLEPIRSGRERSGSVAADRWQAELSLAVGDWSQAVEVATRGLNRIESGTNARPETRNALQNMVRGAAALDGDRNAIAELHRQAVAFAEGDAWPASAARGHLLCARAWKRIADFDEAIDACLQAIDIADRHGLYGRLAEMYLEMGMLYRRQGRLGIARQYFTRGRRLVDEVFETSVRSRLLVEEAALDVALRRSEAAQSLVERASELVDESTRDSMRAVYCKVAGDLARLQGRRQSAIDWYEQAVDSFDNSAPGRAEACLYAAETHLDADASHKAQQWLHRALSLLEDGDSGLLECHSQLVRARLWWHDGDRLEKMTGVERFQRHLRQAADDGEHLLVLEQSRHLWERIADEDRPEWIEELSELFYRAREAVASGLDSENRRRFLDGLADIPPPDAKRESADSDAVADDRIERLEREVEELTDTNEELRKRLAERNRAVEVLQDRLQRLEDQLDDHRRGRASPGRGRRPKARRDEVVEALRGNDADYGRAADELGVSTRTLYRYVNRYDIDTDEI